MQVLKSWGRLALSAVMAGGLISAAGCSDSSSNPTPKATFTVTVANTGPVYDYLVSGVFNTPAGSSAPGPLFSGAAYEFDVAGGPGSSVSFATMVVQSNDLFFGPDGNGIALFDNQGVPITGDVTSQVMLWDAGVELNEEPGTGPNQPLRQGAPNTGPADTDSSVRLVNDGFTYPSATEALRVTVTHNGGHEFTIRIQNLNESSPLAPGVFVVHAEPNPLFTEGQPDRGQGLEALAEDGNPASLGGELAARTGLTTPFAPGVFVLHRSGFPLFREGFVDYGNGLEALAEDGNPGVLALAGATAFNTPDGAGAPAPIFPGESYSFTFDAQSGEFLSFATMLVQSNDLFVAPDDAGADLFPAGRMLTGDITHLLDLWDAGTETDQVPGAGPDQAPRQAGPNTGAADANPLVRLVQDERYPALEDMIRVTVTAVR